MLSSPSGWSAAENAACDMHHGERRGNFFHHLLRRSSSADMIPVVVLRITSLTSTSRSSSRVRFACTVLGWRIHVIRAVRDLKIDLSDVREVDLRNQLGSCQRLMTSQEMMKKILGASRGAYRRAFSTADQRPKVRQQDDRIEEGVRSNCGKFSTSRSRQKSFPGAWLTGRCPANIRNAIGASAESATPAGLVEDHNPGRSIAGASTAGWVIVVTGCGHAGIINILTFARQNFPTSH